VRDCTRGREVRDKTLSASFIRDYGNGPSELIWALGQFSEVVRKITASVNRFMEAGILKRRPLKMDHFLRRLS
jgi:hypothetical protein